MDPVIIVGAGPVGLATALFLARHEVPSTVLEAAARRDAVGSKAICFQRDVLDLLGRLGPARALVDRGVTWTTGRTYYGDRELFSVTFPSPDPGAVPPWINISQTEVEAHLAALVAAQPLIDVRFGHPVIGLRDTGDGVEVDAATPHARIGLYGSHVVGTDGARSTVRQLLGVDFPGRSFADQFLICDIRADLPFPSERRFFFDPAWNPGRQVLLHQCPDGVWRIDWQVPADYDLAADRASGALDARIRAITGDAPYEVVWASAYRFHERCAATFRRGRGLLAGDAAHLYAPFGARGLNSGLQDAENLAWKLAAVRHGHAPDALLDSYDAERRAAAAENLRVTTRTMEFLVPQDDDQRHRRTTALKAALADPDARASIDSGKLAEPFWYLDSPLTTPAGSLADFPTEPGAARPPVPGVLCPDGPCDSGTRLRDLFGDGFTVLVADAADRAAAERDAAGVPFPARVHALPDLDPAGALAGALDATDRSVHLVRPDGHLAAVLPRYEPAAFTAALRRATGRP
ncbi:FAD-dependent monooxygenase [Actinomadura parmotrematis]|uniref:FAD-dependent monooxygenase n=1 Tax=Actinomadura parmotrematis TaxID=2864039 RepID=A0ABS7G0Z7_9ACTN|nr:FAD-dependent monooxygenase [Actinomadura parmotrematis]MBW8485880.1 FAD-dependent monooxygenase [Actinomadura parmotrematis]